MDDTLFKPSYFERLLSVGDLPVSSRFVYRNGGTMNQRCCGEGNYTFFAAYNSEVVSDDVIVVGDEGRKAFVLVGALTAKRSLTHLSAVWRGGKLREIKIWQPEIREGEKPEEIVVLRGDDWRKLLLEYGRLVAKAMEAPAVDHTAPNTTGYCTWYYYYADVTEKDFLENVDALAKYRDVFPTRYVQIDDGYQAFQGDWNDQDASWPTPLDVIARKITSKGMEAGIWTMPFHASTASRVFREHPEWFVKGPDGKPLVAKGWSPPPDDQWATLDTTQPAVLEHLKKIFRTFREWGYTYFKMDGLGFALVDGTRSDPNATSVSAFRQGLQAIRDAVPDSFLLACSQHFLPCVGLVDGARFSDDTHASHGPICRCFNQTLNRFWMFDWFAADPDVLIARQDRGTQTIGESRISVLSGILTGFSLTSDNLATMTAERRELLARGARYRVRDVIPSTDRPVDGNPCVFTGTLDGLPAAAIVNETSEPMTFKLSDIKGFKGATSCEELLSPLGRLEGETVTVPACDGFLLVRKQQEDRPWQS